MVNPVCRALMPISMKSEKCAWHDADYSRSKNLRNLRVLTWFHDGKKMRFKGGSAAEERILFSAVAESW